MSLLVKRPANMSYEEFSRQRTEQNKKLKKLLKRGALVHLSKIPGLMSFKGRTYVKPEEDTVDTESA